MLLFLETPPLRRWFPEWERFWRNKKLSSDNYFNLLLWRAVASDRPLKVWLAIE
jgi:hypothetical protein